jgi:F0F1-type ATP synthase assembly protein I
LGAANVPEASLSTAARRRNVREQKPGEPVQAQWGRYLGVGMTWALSTALFLYLGTVVDGRLKTEPWFTVIGAVVGASAGFYSLYRQLMKGTPSGKRDVKEGGS